jgi:Uma2 family endonuclease
MVTRVQGGVDVVFQAPRWSERWVLQDDVTMPETESHLLTTRLLMDVFVAWIARNRRDAKAGSNLALRWDHAHPKVGVDPDVYLVEPAPPDANLRSLRTWEKGHHAPRVAVEVVSRRTAKKDYGEGPAKYAASGTRELWIFDPEG